MIYLIPVTKPFLPPKEKYINIIDKVWDNNWLTNNGPVLQNLEINLVEYLKTPNMVFVTNGTIALQLAIKALELKGEVITTPFSFVATTNSIIWENCEPVYVDINPDTLCINADLIEEAITPNTTAILATHVYGIPCDVDKIESIAKKHCLRVVYDAAHAFGVEYKGKSLLSYGDISIISFHATKVFHSIEGGGIIVNNLEFLETIKLLRSFGFTKNNHYLPGINAKNSEFHAAMGLINLEYQDNNLKCRCKLNEIYDAYLSAYIKRPNIPNNTKYIFPYYPIILKDEALLKKIMMDLEDNGIESRRYFYPSLNKIKYTSNSKCPVAEDISKRVLCLPFYIGLEEDTIIKISKIILQNFKE